MKKKLLGIFVCVLLITTVLSVSGTVILEFSPISTSLGDTLYVGGSGPGNYTTIQAAINDANNGDTVFVYDDSSPYHEYVVIDESINLIGEDKHTTVINGKSFYNVVEIHADQVVISGFTINESISTGISIISSNSITISDNIISNIDRLGISVSDFSNHTEILGNRISKCGEYGALRNGSISIFNGCNNNNISGNTIMDNERYGIYLEGSINNDISSNTISNHTYSIYLGQGCKNTYIFKNKITEFHIGVREIENNNIEIYWNDITNGNLGIALEDSSKTDIFQNTLKNCSIILRDSIENNIYYNNFFDFKQYDPDGFFYDSKTRWLTNYWGSPRILPKRIPGVRTLGGAWKIRWLPDVDWRPAQEPFKIPV